MTRHEISAQIHIRPVDRFTLTHTGRLDTDWHQHAEHQLIYAEDGVLYVHTHTRQFLLPAYHGAWIPAGSPHRLVSPSDTTKLWLLYFRPKGQETITPSDVRIFGMSALAREMVRFSARWSDAEEVGKEADPLAANFYATVQRLVAEWCAEPLTLILPHTEDGLLDEVTRYIQENIREPLSIDAVAGIYGVSGRTLMRLFRSQLGITFGTYLRIARIVKAVELLTSPTVSVTAVAYDVGYKSPSSFSQAFRRLTGMSPQEYALNNES